jgi:hypothetical protein
LLKYKELANNNFFNREYKKALFNYSLALKDAPEDKDARVGALLCDFASEREDEAVALFEYYESTKDLEDTISDEVIERLVTSSDIDDDYILELLDNLEENIATFEDGIVYEDFLDLMNREKSFKNVFEDIMFSTKIIIHKKEDFIDFVNLLIENDFRDMALNYVENALLYYPSELFFQKTLKQLEHK